MRFTSPHQRKRGPFIHGWINREKCSEIGGICQARSPGEKCRGVEDTRRALVVLLGVADEGLAFPDFQVLDLVGEVVL